MINERLLRFRDVRLIGADGAQVGIIATREALRMAQDAELDLVLVAPNAQPPVCRIVDYGKFKYEQERREKEHKRKTQDVKGIKISPRIAEHDLGFQVKKAIRFLEGGDKVRITCQFRAREVTRPELGKAKLGKMAELMAEYGIVERQPTLEGRLMTMVMIPKVKIGHKPDGKTESKEVGSKEVQDNRNGEVDAAQSVQQPHVPE